jgi:oligo-1,6-glucosidase
MAMGVSRLQKNRIKDVLTFQSPQTEEYYLHLFCPEQPDLNWENPETRQAIYKSAMEFWLERGVDGFRVDTVNMYSKGEMLDAPITDPSSEWQFAGYEYCNGPRMTEFLGEMNEILEKYDAMTVGECPNTPDMKRVLQYVSAKEKQLNMVFQFVSTLFPHKHIPLPDSRWES